MVRNFNQIFARRSTVCFFVLILFFLSCVLRVAVIATGNLQEVQARQSSYRISFSRPRGTIFDCNLVPLTNRTARTVAAVVPTPRSVMAIRQALSDGDGLADVLSALATEKPAVCTVPNEINCEGITCATVYEAIDQNQPALHTVGTLNAEGHGASGLQAAFDDLLYSKSTSDAVFYTDGHGEPLKGLSAEFQLHDEIYGNGVITTLDTRIQDIAEDVADRLACGCVLVCEAASGKLRAVVSRPTFDPLHPSESFDRTDAPFINRSFSAFSVGSVFKPCVAAAALENGIDGGVHLCTGGLQIADRIFRCHNRSGHGAVNLSQGLAFSCNTFFYQLALTVGASPVYRMASTLGFGQSVRLCNGMESAAGNLPSEQTLQYDTNLANLAIGQGSLLLSPVALSTLYCAIATDGSYRLPSLTEGTLKNGKRENTDLPRPTCVMSPDTAHRLRQDLVGVIATGTGIPAKPQCCSAGGKTATAQTGRYDQNGNEINHGWFCGFFPAEQPDYVVIIFSENATGSDTAPIFAELADRIFSVSQSW